MADGDENEVDGPDGGVVAPGSPTSGNQTMQIDAFVEELDEASAVPGDAILAQVLADSRDDEGVAGTLPPPLPPKKVGKGTMVIGALIVLLAVGGGVFFGMTFLEDEEAPATASSPDATGTSDEDLAQRERDEAGSVAESGDEVDDEGAFVPIQLEEVTIQAADEGEGE